MGRKGDGESIRNVIKKIRKEIPNAIIRTSLIVGFPGETKEEFNELKEFVAETKFNRLGVFKYSMEDGTPALKLDGHMDEKIKQERLDIIMAEQQGISKNFNSSLIGKEFECLIDGITNDDKYYIARTYMDVPETDGLVFIEAEKSHQVGDFVNVIIEDAVEYDLIAKEK